MTNNKKILVVGAGVAGPAVCFWLKKYGYSPTLVERNAGLRKGGYAIDVRGIAIDVAKQMGLYQAICAMRTTLTLGRYVDAAGNTLHEESGEQHGLRQGDEVEILRGDLVDILMQAIPDVPCFYSQTIARIEQQTDHVDVHFHDGKSAQYELIIAADGLHSSLRRMIFMNDEYQMRELGAFISIFTIPNYLKLLHTNIMFERDHKIIHISSDKDQQTALAGLMFRSSQALSDMRDEHQQRQFIRDHFLDLGWESNTILSFMEASDDFYFDSITQVNMNTWTKGRVALLGDAGYCASPLSGQGTSLALVGAYILAGELNAADGDVAKAFARYNSLMRPFVDANQALGAWVSETYLMPEALSAELTEERSQKVLAKLKSASSAISLPRYGGEKTL